MPTKILHARLRQLRGERGETLQDVADAIGVSEPHVWNIENGRQPPSSKLLHRLASHFDVPSFYLIDENNSPSMFEAQRFAMDFGPTLSLAHWKVLRQVASSLTMNHDCDASDDPYVLAET